MTPLNWTVMATHVPPGGSLGGVVRYTTELIRALAERDDVNVSVITTRGAADFAAELVGSARVGTVPNLPVPLLSITDRFAPLPAAQRGADVVQGTKHLVPRLGGALKVLTIHDMLLLDRPGDFGLPKRVLLPPTYRSSIRGADLLLCVSAASRDRLAAQVPGAQARADVVHLATSSSLRQARPEPLTALTGRRYALVVGDSSRRKNLTTLMAAWPRVREQHPDAVLAVAGPPNWGGSEVGEQFAALVDSGAVIALGHVSDAELRWAYENAAIVLAPSLAEGFGLPAAEALDFGAPVIISDDPALNEVCAGRERAVVPALATDEWTAAIVDALAHPELPGVGVRPTARTWADVAQDTVASVRRALDHRAGLLTDSAAALPAHRTAP